MKSRALLRTGLTQLLLLFPDYGEESGQLEKYY